MTKPNISTEVSRTELNFDIQHDLETGAHHISLPNKHYVVAKDSPDHELKYIAMIMSKHTNGLPITEDEILVTLKKLRIESF